MPDTGTANMVCAACVFMGTTRPEYSRVYDGRVERRYAELEYNPCRYLFPEKSGPQQR